MADAKHTDNGGPAFASAGLDWHQDGMSLRDYFAAQLDQSHETTLAVPPTGNPSPILLPPSQTRLTANHRTVRSALVTRIVDCPVEIKAEASAYAKALPLARKVVEATFKPADMEVFAKYDLSRTDKCINVQLEDQGVVRFAFLARIKADSTTRMKRAA